MKGRTDTSSLVPGIDPGRPRAGKASRLSPSATNSIAIRLAAAGLSWAMWFRMSTRSARAPLVHLTRT